MNSPFQLFVKRVKYYFSFQYKATRLFIDAITAVYLLVPSLLLGGFYMRHVWLSQPDYLFQISPIFIALLLFLIVISSVFHSFYEYGDQLFLIQNKAWYYKIKQYGLLYTIMLHLIANIGLFLVILPVLYIGLNYSWLHIALLCVFSSLCSTFISLVKRRIAIVRNQWRRLFLNLFLFICLLLGFSYVISLESTSVLVGLCLIIVVILCYVLLRRPLSYTTHFVEFASYDLKMHYKYLKLILSSGDYKLPSVKKYTREPWIFKRSNPLFKARTASHILVENSVKQFLRNKQYVAMYIYFTCVSAYPLLLMPLSGKVVYTLVMVFIYWSIGKKIWQLFMFDDFMKLYKWSSLVQSTATKMAVKMFALPMFTLLTIVLLVTSSTLIEFIGAVITSVLGYFIIIRLGMVNRIK